MTRLAVLALTAGVLTAVTAPAYGADDEALRPGDEAPPWSLPSRDGETVRYPEAADGRPSVVFFWATWCPFCTALMPELAAIREDYAAAGVEVFAVNVWEEGDPVAYLSEAGYDFVLALEGDQVAEAWNVTGTPGLFVVDGTGTVVMNRFLVDLSVRAPAAGARKPSPAEAAGVWGELTREALVALLAAPPARLPAD